MIYTYSNNRTVFLRLNKNLFLYNLDKLNSDINKSIFIAGFITKKEVIYGAFGKSSGSQPINMGRNLFVADMKELSKKEIFEIKHYRLFCTNIAGMIIFNNKE